jgi:hypothetical protein
MASAFPLLGASILRQILFLSRTWRDKKQVEYTSMALQRLSIAPCDVEAWKCLAAMTLEHPALHLEILYTIRHIAPDDRANERRIKFAETPTSVLSQSEVMMDSQEIDSLRKLFDCVRCRLPH